MEKSLKRVWEFCSADLIIAYLGRTNTLCALLPTYGKNQSGGNSSSANSASVKAAQFFDDLFYECLCSKVFIRSGAVPVMSRSSVDVLNKAAQGGEHHQSQFLWSKFMSIPRFPADGRLHSGHQILPS